MRLRSIFIAAASGLMLTLAGCDSVAIPGFDKRPSDREDLPPPPNTPIDDTPVTLPVAPDPTPTPDPINTTPTETPAPEDTDELEDPAPDESTPETPDVADDNSDDETELTESDPTETGPTGTEPAEDIIPEGSEEDIEQSDDVVEDAASTDEATSDEDNLPAEDTSTVEETENVDEATEAGKSETTETLPVAPVEPTFAYHAPGDLIPGSGLGAPDKTVFAPDMVFPIQTARTFPHSQVFRPGGFRYSGDLPGDECIPENYEYPWRDNFCERGRRATFVTPYCPAGSGIHQGQDIRVGDGATCESMRRRYRTNTQSITDYKVVAAEDGVISNISTYLVSVRAGPRTYRYLHLNMRALQVSVGDEVKAGQLLGYVSKDFGFNEDGTRRPTTFHLHFEIKINTENGTVFVPPYTSLVEAYARREGGPGEELERALAIASDVSQNTSKEVFEFSE